MKDPMLNIKNKYADTTAYYEGYNAYFDDIPKKNNPHKLHCDDWHMWLSGWLEAKLDKEYYGIKLIQG